MNGRPAYPFLFALVTAIVPCLSHAGAPEVSLTIEAAPTQRVSDGLRVTATVSVLGSTPYIVLPPLLQVPPWASGTYPSTEFVVEVTDLQGKAIPKVPVDPNIIYVQSAPPNPCEFLILRAGQFAGVVLRLSDPPFGYVLSQGKVRVRIGTRSTARAWLADALRGKRVAAASVCFGEADVYDRPLTSKEIEVSLE